jgi:hypothetical protein
MSAEMPKVSPFPPGSVSPGPEEEVDLDLDVESEALHREAVRDPTTIRISGTVIHITHTGDWSQSAMVQAAQGNWEQWARLVIEDDDEFQAWMDADLHNYQIEAVFQQCGRAARMTMGKSSRPSGPQRRTRKR